MFRKKTKPFNDCSINWEGVGYSSVGNFAKMHRAHKDKIGKWPHIYHTNNNKLQMSARALEMIYTLTNWPPKARALPVSLKDSGKSRADLWQFAANVALEKLLLDGTNGMAPERPLPFRTGRSDCVADPAAKMSPYPFEASKQERYYNYKRAQKYV